MIGHLKTKKKKRNLFRTSLVVKIKEPDGTISEVEIPVKISKKRSFNGRLVIKELSGVWIEGKRPQGIYVNEIKNKNIKIFTQKNKNIKEGKILDVKLGSHVSHNGPIGIPGPRPPHLR